MSQEFIPLSVPTLRGKEWTYIKECLDTNWVSYVGPFVSRFEKELAACCGAQHAVAMASGTASLHLALLMAGVEPGSEVVMPAVTFVAPANAVRYCDAWPVLIDLSERDWQLDVEKLADFLALGCERKPDGLFNRETGRRVAALMPVHLLGDMADVDAIAGLAQRYDLPLVEDAAECMGASYKGRGMGAPLDSLDSSRRIVCTSFNGNKIVTTGGGGAVLTNDAALAARAKHLSTTAKTNSLEFFHDEIGYNYRLTNVAAAMGVAQLEQLGEFARIKRGIAARYKDAFAGDDHIRTHVETEFGQSIFWLYTVLLAQPAMPVITALNTRGIQSRPLWMPIARLPMFEGSCFSYRVEFAPELHRRAVSLPCSVGLAEEEQQRVIAALRECLQVSVGM